MTSGGPNPFESPQAELPAGAMLGNRGALSDPYVHPYEPALQRAKFSIAFVIVCVVCHLISLYMNHHTNTLITQQPARTPSYDYRSRPTTTGRTSNRTHKAWQEAVKVQRMRSMQVNGVLAPFEIASAVLFLMWFHRMHRNLRALGNRRLRFTPGWAVGWWFIPLVNLIAPFLAMSEIWQGSVPRDDPEAIADPRRNRRSVLIIVWWSLFLLPRMSGLRFFVLILNLVFGVLLTLTWIETASAVISVLSGGVTVMMIGLATKNQDDRYYLLRSLAKASQDGIPNA